MKKLSKIQLKDFNASELSEDQMKNILGGSLSVDGCDSSSCSGKCTIKWDEMTISGECARETTNNLCGCKF